MISIFQVDLFERKIDYTLLGLRSMKSKQTCLCCNGLTRMYFYPESEMIGALLHGLLDLSWKTKILRQILCRTQFCIARNNQIINDQAFNIVHV